MRFSLVLFFLYFGSIDYFIPVLSVRKSTNKGSEITNHPNQLPHRKKAISNTHRQN